MGGDNQTITNRGTIDYTNPDLSTGGRPMPRNQPSTASNEDASYQNPFDDPMFWFRKS